MKPISLQIVKMTAISVVSVFVFLTTTTDELFAQESSLIGAWKFVPEKSRFEPGPAPYKSMTLNFSETDRGLENDVDGMDAEGRQINGSFMIVTDGKTYPVTGMSAFDSSSYTPVSDSTTVYVRNKLGTTVIVGSRVLSHDGKTLTYSEKTVDRDGRERGRALLVFERESVATASQ